MPITSLAMGTNYPTGRYSINGDIQQYRDFVPTDPYAIIYSRQSDLVTSPTLGDILDTTSTSYFNDLKNKGVLFSSKFDYLAVNSHISGSLNIPAVPKTTKTYTYQSSGLLPSIGAVTNDVLNTGVSEYIISTHTLGYVPALLSSDTDTNETITSFRTYKVSDRTFRNLIFLVDANTIRVKEFWQTFEADLPAITFNYEVLLLDQGLDSSGLSSSSTEILLSPSEINIGEKLKSDRSYLRVAAQRDFPYPVIDSTTYSTNESLQGYDSTMHSITDDYYYELKDGVAKRYSYSNTASSLTHSFVDTYDFGVSSSSLIALSQYGEYLYIYDQDEVTLYQYQLSPFYSLASPTLVDEKLLGDNVVYSFQTLDVYDKDKSIFFGGANGRDGIMRLEMFVANKLPEGTNLVPYISSTSYIGIAIEDTSYIVYGCPYTSDHIIPSEEAGGSTYNKYGFAIVEEVNTPDNLFYAMPYKHDVSYFFNYQQAYRVQITDSDYFNSLDVARDQNIACFVTDAVDGLSNIVKALYINRFNESTLLWDQQTTIAIDGVNLNPDSRFDLSGDRIFVSGDNNKVYVFDYNGTSWVQSEITHTNFTTHGIRSMGAMGDSIVVALDNSQETLMYFTYDTSNWNYINSIVKPDTNSEVSFGHTIVVSKDEDRLYVLSDGTTFIGFRDYEFKRLRCNTYMFNLSGNTWTYSDKVVYPDIGNAFVVDDIESGEYLLYQTISVSKHVNDWVHLKQVTARSGGDYNMFKHHATLKSDASFEFSEQIYDYFDSHYTLMRPTEGQKVDTYYLSGRAVGSPVMFYGKIYSTYGPVYSIANFDTYTFIDEDVDYYYGKFSDTEAGNNLLAFADDGYTQYLQSDGNQEPGLGYIPYTSFYAQMKLISAYEMTGQNPEAEDYLLSSSWAYVETIKFIDNNTKFLYTKRNNTGLFMADAVVVIQDEYTNLFSMPKGQSIESFAWYSTTYDSDTQIQLGLITNRIEDGVVVDSYNNAPYDYVTQTDFPVFPGLQTSPITSWPDYDTYSADGKIVYMVS